MLDVLHQLAGGFLHVLTPVNFAALVVGLVVGMLVAVLPGLTLVMGVVLALPFTYGMSITPSIILLTAMYISGTYGGAITSILFRIPGEPMDVPLLWDGYSMAHAGQPAQALGWTLFAALTGGLITALVMVTLAVPFAKIALSFDTPEYFAIVLFGFTSVVALGGGRRTKEDSIDPSVGLVLEKKTGDRVAAGEAIARLHVSKAPEGGLVEAVTEAFEITGTAPAPERLVLARLTSA